MHIDYRLKQETWRNVYAEGRCLPDPWRLLIWTWALEGGFERPCSVLLVILYSAAESGRLRKYLAVAYHSEYVREPYIVEISVQALSLKLE